MRRGKTRGNQVKIGLAFLLVVLAAAGEGMDRMSTWGIAQAAEAEGLIEDIEDQESDLLIIDEETNKGSSGNILEGMSNQNAGNMGNSREEGSGQSSRVGTGSDLLEEEAEILSEVTGDASGMPEDGGQILLGGTGDALGAPEDRGQILLSGTGDALGTPEDRGQVLSDGTGEVLHTPGEPNAEKVYLGIDNLHLYEGMEQAFSDGYRPVIKDGSLELVIPYVASGKLKGDKLTVNLEFGSQQGSPFELKNYLKDVTKKEYRQVNGVMQEVRENTGVSEDALNGASDGAEVYLYKCRVPIREKAEPGQYSVTVKAWGYTENMNTVTLDYQIFFRIPEPEPESESESEPGSEVESELENEPGSEPQSEPESESGSEPQSESENEPGSEAESESENEPGSEPQSEPESEAATETENEAEGVYGGGYGGGGGYAAGGGETAEEIVRQPKMLLESCSLTEKNLEAGNTETMQVSLQNRSQSQSMYNLKVVLQTESKVLKLERNSFYYEKVAPGEIISLDEEVRIAQDAEAGVVPLTFSFEYEDKKGTSATGTELVNLTVTQPVEMELEKAEIPAFVYASDTIEIPVSVLNLSRTGVYNARVHMEGTGLFPTGDVFIGNMEAGSSGDGSMKVYVGTRTMEAIGMDNGTDDGAKYGAVKGKITLSYEDALGETHKISRDYQTEIKKAQILSLNVDEEQETGNPWWISVFAVLILGMFVAILLLFARLHRKNVLLEEARKA